MNGLAKATARLTCGHVVVEFRRLGSLLSSYDCCSVIKSDGQVQSRLTHLRFFVFVHASMLS